MNLRFWNLFHPFLLAPDDLAAAAGGDPPPSSDAPATPTTTDSVPSETPIAPPAAPAPESTMDWLRSQGYQDLASQYKDEKELIQGLIGQHQHLSAQAQQYLHLAPVVQQVLPHWSQFQEYMKSRQQAQPKEKPWHAQWWNPPDYDPALDQFIKLDDQGNPLPSTPPHILAKRQEYDAYVRAQAQKFWQNPVAFIEEPVKHLIEKHAKELIQQNLGRHTEDRFAQEYVEKNPWLFQQDAKGNHVYTQVQLPTGQIAYRKTLSPAGQRFQSLVAEAEQLGISNVQAQQLYAEKLLRAELASQQASSSGAGVAQVAPAATPSPAAASPGQPVQKTPEQIKADFVKSQASTNSSFAGRTPPAPHPASGPVTPKSFMDIAREEAAAMGQPF